MIEMSNFMIADDATLADVLSKIDQNGYGVCFITSSDDVLLGTLSDGDIRRALLKGTTLEDQCVGIMNTDFISLPVQSDNLTILKTLSSKIKVIPLLSDSGTIMDLATSDSIRKIPVSAPYLGGNELAYVADCVKSTWVSSSGKYVSQFQDMFADYCGANHALAVSNGTVAIHLALEALGIGEGDEVIVPGLTFAASINAIIYTGATPVIADINPETLNIEPESIKRVLTENTAAIMPVHLYGYPCDMSEVRAIADKYNLLVVEDCAEALGSTYKGIHVGADADAATFSFFGNKTITTGEGGMVLFKDADIYEKATVLKDHGMNKKKRYWHDYVGYNYRMTNMQAALGVAQMEQVEHFVEKKRQIADIYSKAFENLESVILPKDGHDYKNSYWLYTLILQRNIRVDTVISLLQSAGVETRPIFYPLHVMPPYSQFPKDGDMLGVSSVAGRGISLPSSTNLKVEEAEFVARQVVQILKDLDKT